ncbi:MAG: transglycosylase SLT domain-containing protein [Erythrobacter sp.]
MALAPASLPAASTAIGTPQAKQTALQERAEGGATRQIRRADTTRNVEQAIATAAQSTSVDFDYLVAQAQVESAMNPTAQARTSSASGLFQFIESTWLNTVKRHGPRFGFDDVAAQIGVTRGGSAYVPDPSQREAILALRNDPQIASLMAAGLAEDNRGALMPILGRQPEHRELYLAHFLGAGGAGRFLSAMQSDPYQSAAALFRRPAAANRAVFYEAGGAPRSLAGVMDYLGAKMERAGAGVSAMPGGNSPNFAFAPNTPPANPPQITGAGNASLSAASTFSLPSATAAPPIAPSRAPRTMSGLLSASMNATGVNVQASQDGTEHIRRAYHRLRALGL